MTGFQTAEIQREQRWDRQKMGALWVIRDKLDQGTAKKLDYYYKSRNKGTVAGSTNIVYKMPKSWVGALGYGRLYSQHGLETFEADVRGTLCSGLYYDIDMENAHPVLLHQFAKKVLQMEMPETLKFCKNRDEYYSSLSDNRDEAKKGIFQILYGGKTPLDTLQPFKSEVELFSRALTSKPEYQKLYKGCQKEAKPNLLGSFISYVLQTEERRCLMALFNYFTSKGWNVDVLAYDGVMIRKEQDKEIDDEILKDAAAAVYQATGYLIALKSKAFSSFPDKELLQQAEVERKKLLAPNVLVDDSWAAEQFVGLCGNHLTKLSDGTLLGFDSETGLWTPDITPLIHQHRKKLIWKQDRDFKIHVYNYGGLSKSRKALVEFLPQFVKERSVDVESSIGKLLWSDGIYDFNTRTFTKGFDPSVVFRARINRKFPSKRNRELEALVSKILFQDPFLAEQKEQAEFFKTAVARALYGDYRAKRAYITVGQANCGRGLLTCALQNAFEGYVAMFNTSSLYDNPKSSEDDAKRNAWLLQISDARLSISNEAPMGSHYIDANLLKSAASGGDIIKGRFNHKDAVEFVNRSTLFILTNDIPEIKPADRGLLNRICVSELKKTYCASPELGNPYQALEDRTLKDKVGEDDWKDALFWVLEEAWAAFAQTDRVAKKPAAVELAISEWVETSTTIASILEQRFQITKNPDDRVEFRELEKYLRSKGCIDSTTKIGRELSGLGIENKVIKMDGVARRCRVGIRRNPMDGLSIG
jgi:hypothetical protein